METGQANTFCVPVIRWVRLQNRLSHRAAARPERTRGSAGFGRRLGSAETMTPKTMHTTKSGRHFRGGDMATPLYTLFKTRFGPCGIARQDEAITAIRFPEAIAAGTAEKLAALGA